ncbi:MAG: hypothetical protein ACREWI_17970 [Telluria sp.]
MSTNRSLRQLVLLALATAWAMPAAAQDVIPSHLTGVWCTAESLFAGADAQQELQLQADGFGMLVGSSKPHIRTDGKPHEGTPPRVVMGFPLRATLDGNALTAQMFLPPGASVSPRDKGPTPEQMKVACSYEAQGETLTCVGMDRVQMVMKRRSETLPAQTVDILKKIQSQLAGGAGR